MLRFTEHRTVPGHGFIVVAYRASEFRRIYGFSPDYEVIDTDPSVPEVAAEGSFRPQPLGDEVMLLNGSGVVSVVYYGSTWMGARPGPCPSPGESIGLAIDGVATGYMDTDLAVLQPSPGRGNNGAPAPVTEASPLIPAIILAVSAAVTLILRRELLSSPR